MSDKAAASDGMNAVEAAVTILRRGFELDSKQQYAEALVCYQEGLQILLNSLKCAVDERKKKYIRVKVEEYMDRAECVKRKLAIQKITAPVHRIIIEENSTGHSYKALFGKYLDGEVQFVLIEDPYIRAHHQCMNFLRLCELLVVSCPNMRTIDLLTTQEPPGKEQSEKLALIADSLKKYNIQLTVKFSESLHDRQITLSTGWIIKIGRGLDIYKPIKNKVSLGLFDLDLRPCHETTVDIVHSTFVKKSYG